MRKPGVLYLGIAVLGFVGWLCLATSGEIASPDVYLYIPRISFTPAEHHCLDCKTFALVAVMRYYGEHVEFEDICREVGEPPGARYEDIAFFRRLIEFARSRGFVVENHFWTVDEIAAQVEIGRPVIASHRFGDLPAEPGIVKGCDDTHVWVWGIQEFIQQSSKDSYYTRDQFQALLERRDSGTGMMGCVPEIFSSATNCLLVYKPGAKVTAQSYDIDAVPYSERIQRLAESSPGVVRTLSLTGQGEMRWSGEFLAGHDKTIEVVVYDDEYVTSSAGEPVIVFAVRLLPGSRDAGSVIQGYSRAEKSVWSTPLGYTFEEVLLPVVRSGNAWVATIVVCPVGGLEQVIVKWPADCENRPFFGYEISVVE